jgi:hypothetical protein
MTTRSDQNHHSGLLQSATGHQTLFVLAMVVLLIFALGYVF